MITIILGVSLLVNTLILIFVTNHLVAVIERIDSRTISAEVKLEAMFRTEQSVSYLRQEVAKLIQELRE